MYIKSVLIMLGLLFVISDLTSGQIRCSPYPCAQAKTFVVSIRIYVVQVVLGTLAIITNIYIAWAAEVVHFWLILKTCIF